MRNLLYNVEHVRLARMLGGQKKNVQIKQSKRKKKCREIININNFNKNIIKCGSVSDEKKISKRERDMISDKDTTDKCTKSSNR